MDLVGTADWIMGVIGESVTKFIAMKSAKIIFSACNNGSYETILWAVTTIEKYGSLHKELEGIYDTYNNEKVTLLLFLCHMNTNDMRSIQLLRQKGFPTKLLMRKMEGRNVLEKALMYNNLEMACQLLKDDEWAQKLIPSEENFMELICQTETKSEMYILLKTRFEELKNGRIDDAF